MVKVSMEGERDRLMDLELSTTIPDKPRDVGFVISLSLGREKIASLIVELSVGVTMEVSPIRRGESGASATVSVIPKSCCLGENCFTGTVRVGSPDREAALPLSNS